MLIDFRELLPKYNIKPKGICHVGSNRGEEYPVYMEMGIKKQVWYEANPAMYELLLETIKDNPEAIGYNLCVGNEFKEVILHESNNQGQSSSVLELGTHKTAHPEVYYQRDIPVQMVRLENLLMDKNMDFLNCDVQGFELEVLKGMGELIKQFKGIYLEVNNEHLYINCPLVGELDEYLEIFGFTRVETFWSGNSGWGDALWVLKKKKK